MYKYMFMSEAHEIKRIRQRRRANKLVETDQ